MKLVDRRSAMLAVLALVMVAVAAPSASAAVWVRAAPTVAAGSPLALTGAVGDMRIYLVPLTAFGYVPGRCDGCASLAIGPPQAPAILLGRGPGSTKTVFVTRHFSLKVPGTVAPGRYRVTMYCAECIGGPGGNVIFGTGAVRVTQR